MNQFFYFGQYLVKAQHVTEEEMLAALKYQKDNTLSFEEAALKLQILTMKQVFQIMSLQVDSDLSIAELAIMHNFITSADILSINELIAEKKQRIGECLVELKYITKDVLDTALKKYTEEISKYVDIANSLKNINLFANVKDSAFNYLAKIAKKETFEKNIRIISEDEDATAFYAVVSGRVKITRCNPVKPDDEVFIGEIVEKDVFGESCIFEKGKRTANITALCKTTLLCLGRDDFISFLNNHPKSSVSVLSFIIQRLMMRLEGLSREMAVERKHGTNPHDLKHIFDDLKG